jgi:hypothetical protein
MARHESDREDLMAEATAYTRRVEFTVVGLKATIVAGLRNDDTLAIYFNQDPMYQFSSNGQLRRGLVDETLFRAGSNTLSKLKRRRTEQETVLESSDLSLGELTCFLQEMDRRIQIVQASIGSGTAIVTRTVPPDAGPQILKIVAARLKSALHASPRVAPPINTTR